MLSSKIDIINTPIECYLCCQIQLPTKFIHWNSGKIREQWNQRLNMFSCQDQNRSLVLETANTYPFLFSSFSHRARCCLTRALRYFCICFSSSSRASLILDFLASFHSRIFANLLSIGALNLDLHCNCVFFLSKIFSDEPPVCTSDSPSSIGMVAGESSLIIDAASGTFSTSIMTVDATAVAALTWSWDVCKGAFMKRMASGALQHRLSPASQSAHAWRNSLWGQDSPHSSTWWWCPWPIWCHDHINLTGSLWFSASTRYIFARNQR